MDLRAVTSRVPPAFALACLLAAGCQLSHRVRQTDTGAADYRRCNIAYDLNARYRDLPLVDDTVQPASIGDAAPATMRWKGARLTITYPHPDGTPSMARATLRLSGGDEPVLRPVSGTADAAPTWMQRLHDPVELFADRPEPPPATLTALHTDEIWILDIPRSEVDLLLADLSQSGFFSSQARPDRGTYVDVQVDAGRTQKTWTPDSRLDEFVHRVYGQGRLSGFVAANATHQPLTRPDDDMLGDESPRLVTRLRLARRRQAD